MISQTETDRLRKGAEYLKNWEISYIGVNKENEIDLLKKIFEELNSGYVLLRKESYRTWVFFYPLRDLTRLLERKDLEVVEIYRPEN